MIRGIFHCGYEQEENEDILASIEDPTSASFNTTSGHLREMTLKAITHSRPLPPQFYELAANEYEIYREQWWDEGTKDERIPNVSKQNIADIVEYAEDMGNVYLILPM